MPTPDADRPGPPAAHDGQRSEVLAFLRDMQQRRSLDTLEPVLPLLLNIDGNPLTLKDHFYFAPLYRTHLPDVRVIKTARQQGKSSYAASLAFALMATTPRFTQLFITPLFEQIRRFSVNVVEPMIEESPIRSLLVDTSCNRSVLQRTFRNRAMAIFSYAYLSVGRVRGISRVWRTSFDETQDMYMDHVPVIMETMSHAPDPWGVVDYTGTPKGLDNPVEELWSQSSQAEWFVRCPHGGCGHYNIAAAEYDLLKMIGPMRDDISPDSPGVVCARCGKPIDPRPIGRGAGGGFWKHRYPEKRWTFQGFHVSQPIAPLHYGSPKKWAKLLAKRDGRGNYTENKFWNECLGESLDSGAKLVTKSDLQAAAVLPWENDPKHISDEIVARRAAYTYRVLGIDWGGGGGEQISGRSESARRQRVSFTSVAYLGIRYDGKIDVLWGCRLNTPNDHIREANEIMRIVRRLKPDAVAHDFGGAGSLRETLMVERGYPARQMLGIVYNHAPSRAIMVRVAEDTEADVRGHYRVDRTRTLLTTIAAIRLGFLRFFKFDYKSSDDPGLLTDFTALTEEKMERDAGVDLYVIRRLTALSDDFAHAVNVGCCALWHRCGWPDFADSVHQGPESFQGDDGWSAGD